MTYSHRVFDSIDEIDLTAWQRVCAESRASIFMDPRFIAGVEVSMRPSCRFWYVIIYDEEGPVACAGLTAMTIDLAALSDPRLGWVIRRMPVLSRFQKLKVLFCSLPGSPGEKSLALAQTKASREILSVLDGVMHDIAKDTGTDVIVYKEFAEKDLQWMNPLLEAGYRCIPIPPMHTFSRSFPDFAQYCAALKTRYRQQINRSVRKLKNAGIAQSVVTDPKEILRLYTPEVHDMYCQMVDKSDVKLEVLPIEYFRQLTLRLGPEADLIALFRDSRIIAFGWGLHDGSTYHMTYAGLDYRLNHEVALYFNLMYPGFDRAFRKGVATINAGQTAAAFKARIGCGFAPLYLFAKGIGPMMSRIFYYGARFLLIEKSSSRPSEVFKIDSGCGPNGCNEAVPQRRDPQILS